MGGLYEPMFKEFFAHPQLYAHSQVVTQTTGDNGLNSIQRICGEHKVPVNFQKHRTFQHNCSIQSTATMTNIVLFEETRCPGNSPTWTV